MKALRGRNPISLRLCRRSVNCKVIVGSETVDGLIYYPHPESKPEHFHPPDILEVLLPWLQGVQYGAKLQLMLRSDQLLLNCRSKWDD